MQVWEQKGESCIMGVQIDQWRKREDDVMEVEVITRDPYIQLQGQLSLYTVRRNREVPSPDMPIAFFPCSQLVPQKAYI